MTRYYVMSDAVDDLMFEAGSLASAREGIRQMLNETPERGDHRYFPLSIQKDAPRSPYRRKMQIVETYQLNGSVTTYLRTHPNYVRENGETSR